MCGVIKQCKQLFVLSVLEDVWLKLRSSVKNKRDRLFFTLLFVPQASQSSWDRRAELDVRLAIPSAQAPAEWRIK